MAQKLLQRIHAALFLLLLLSVQVGWDVHVFTENPLNFAAFSGDLVPDNGADSGVSERCAVCNYLFSSYLHEDTTSHEFYSEVLAVLLPEATRCKCCDTVLCLSLRAPPVA